MDTENKPHITPLDNGPLRVEGMTGIKTRDGMIDLKPKVHLCRCGRSANKPFCDGKHKENGFNTAKSEDRPKDKSHNYRGANISVHFNLGVCIHSGQCIGTLPSVFNLKAKPWIQPDNADVEEVIKTVNNCPSGALGYTIDDENELDNSFDCSIYMLPNGPFLITGDIKLENTEFGDGTKSSRYALCRCGQSKNKPFCDGAHHQVKFEE